MDPTRELAANAEQANIQTQALGQFAGPQALSARSSGVMGAASKNAADVMAKYNNANVNIANQFESNIANIENQEQQLNTASQQKLYDQNTISNQQYDNTKRALRNNLLNQTTSGITNMMKTDAMNQIYPQFDVDESIGGKVTYDPTKSRKVKPEMSGSSYEAFHKECSKLYKDETQIEKCVNKKLGASSDTGGDDDAQILAQHFPQKKNGGFAYGDITYPFIL
jgi:exonuclease VII large subunit